MEWASEGEDEEDEEASASEEGESQGAHESVGADSDESFLSLRPPKRMTRTIQSIL